MIEESSFATAPTILFERYIDSNEIHFIFNILNIPGYGTLIYTSNELRLILKLSHELIKNELKESLLEYESRFVYHKEAK